MKRLDRYILTEVAVPATVALIALTFTLVARELGRILELIVRGSATMGEIWTLAAALVPGALTFTIPIALLGGILSAFGRLSSDGESVAFRATGVSTWQVFRPVLLLAGLACTANLLLTIWIAPGTAARLSDLTNAITLMRQLPLELEPRVFNEQVSGMVVYLRDISPDGREWSGVLLADVSRPEQLNVTWARRGRLTSNADGTRYEITLESGGTEIIPLSAPDRFSSTSFNVTTIPVPVSGVAPQPAVATPQQIPTAELLNLMQTGTGSVSEAIEFHRRLALPFACFAFAFIGLPLGMSVRRGGRSIGLVVSAVLVLAYYIMFLGGTGAATEASIPPILGTWAANLALGTIGIVLLLRLDRRRSDTRFGKWARPARSAVDGLTRYLPGWPRKHRGIHHATWFRTLDLYVIRRFVFFFLLIIVTFAALVAIVTLFELLPDIVANNVGLGLIASYFGYYAPQILYEVTPLAVLIGVFIALGTLTRSNETLAVRAGAISLYRLAWPLIGLTVWISVSAYFVSDYLLPTTNQLQDAYRDTIKGRAPQTYLNPNRKWMAGSQDQIYFYNYFDRISDTFAELAVFEFDPDAWGLKHLTYGARASENDGRWSLEYGWTRQAERADEGTFEAFDARVFPRPIDSADYFKREARIAEQMTYPELQRYIEGLQGAGFSVEELKVDLYKKFSYPLASLIMALLAIPLAFGSGRQGAFYGIGIAILIGIGYWAAFEVFGKLGEIREISPLIAAWFPNVIFGLTGVWFLLRVRT